MNGNFNVLEMALKTLRFVQGLSRTPLLFFLDISPPEFQDPVHRNKNLENRKSGSLPKQVKVSFFVSAGTVRPTIWPTTKKNIIKTRKTEIL